MVQPYKKIVFFLIFGFFTGAPMFLVGCAKLPWSSQGESVPQKLYIDATRNFAVEFPGNWDRFLNPDYPALPGADAVGWESPQKRENQAAARMTVVIPYTPLSPEEAEAAIRGHLPDLVIENRASERVYRLPALALTGQTARRAYLIYLLDVPRVRFVLVYSAPPEDFETYRGHFRDMVRSFEILR